jgi:hypothetical protein
VRWGHSGYGRNGGSGNQPSIQPPWRTICASGHDDQKNDKTKDKTPTDDTKNKGDSKNSKDQDKTPTDDTKKEDVPKGADYCGYYSTLGLSYTCAQGEVKTAFHKLAARCHPDKLTQEAPSVKSALSSLFVRVVVARETLENPVSRVKYDKECWGLFGPPEPLPAGWSKQLSSSLGTPYYFHLPTKKAQWDKPEN